MHLPSPNLRELVADLSDDEWAALVAESLDDSQWRHEFLLPGFPGAETESMTTMAASKDMLRQANRFYQLSKEITDQFDQPLRPASQVLDFGCGWGRITRYYLRDVDPQNLRGVDVMDELVEACRQTIHPDQFSTVEMTGPLNLDDRSFDLVMANSVFSHLTADRHRYWVGELARVTKPGSLLLLTLVDETTFAEWLQREGDWGEWFHEVVGAPWRAKVAMRLGRFVWRSTSRRGALEGYGQALIPRRWIEREWPTHGLEIVDVRHDYGQAIYVARRLP